MEGEAITEVKAKMLECVTLIINHWPAVKLALENGWVSKNHKKLKQNQEIDMATYTKRFNETEQDVKNRFINELTDFIYDYEVDQAGIEDFLLDFIEENFYMILEDDSANHISKLVYDMNRTLSNGDDSVYNKIKEMAKLYDETHKTETIKEEEKEEEEPENAQKDKEKEAEENQEPPKLVDDDGFTTVVNKKGKKK